MAKDFDAVGTRLESFRRSVEMREEKDGYQRPRTLPPEPRRAVQLPMWPEPVRGGPNALLRSAFFAGIASKKRQKLGTQKKLDEEPEGITIAAQDGIKIKYAGTQLNQYDADVFFEALHRARYHPLETECIFTGNSFLKAIGRSGSEPNYDDLSNSLKRLRNGTVEIEWTIKGRHYIFTGSLVSHYIRETTSKLYKVTFANQIRELFAPACWTQLEWDERMGLKKKPLAQWLHSYYSTHAAPFPISVAFLHEKTGSPTKRRAHFRTEIRRAFDDLNEVLGWVAVWNGDIVTLKRPPSASQGRHLIENAHKRKQKRMPKRMPRGEGGLTAASDLLPGLMKSLKILT
jgi:hypothetical protein